MDMPRRLTSAYVTVLRGLEHNYVVGSCRNHHIWRAPAPRHTPEGLLSYYMHSTPLAAKNVQNLVVSVVSSQARDSPSSRVVPSGGGSREQYAATAAPRSPHRRSKHANLHAPSTKPGAIWAGSVEYGITVDGCRARWAAEGGRQKQGQGQGQRWIL